MKERLRAKDRGAIDLLRPFGPDQQALMAVISEALDRLKTAVTGAVEGLSGLVDAEEKNIRLRAWAGDRLFHEGQRAHTTWSAG